MLEWLISRRKVNTNWKDISIKLQQQFKTLLQDLPKQMDLPKYRDLNYFDIDFIMDQLTTKFKANADKNFFGQYTNEKLKAWSNLKTSYQKNNVYLAEAASTLVQNIKYELPSLKKSIDTYQKQVQELGRKEAEYMKNSNEFKSQYALACQNMKIKGEDIATELSQLTAEIPEHFAHITSLVQKQIFKDAVQFYKSWVTFLRSKAKNKGPIDFGFDVLDHIIQYGNEGVDKIQKRKDPNYNSEDDQEEENVGITVEDTGAESNKIDWGAITLDDAGSTQPEIKVEEQSPAISWDLGATSSINWDITIENEGETDPVLQLIPEKKEKSQKENILENAETRRMFVFCLTELRAFFNQRILEISSRSDTHINLNELDGAPAIIFKNDNLESLKKYFQALEGVINYLEEDRLQNLIEMKNSKNVVGRIAQSIQIKMDHKNVALRNASECKSRAKDIESEIQETHPKLTQIKQYSQQLKKLLEQEISAQHNGRKVRIFGEIDRLA
uniref:Uncharacterized protein n=1 Tax=Arcella intermedia TaxID=1963864 RepID=A0A6B2L1J7_9EUKA